MFIAWELYSREYWRVGPDCPPWNGRPGDHIATPVPTVQLPSFSIDSINQFWRSTIWIMELHNYLGDSINDHGTPWFIWSSVILIMELHKSNYGASYSIMGLLNYSAKISRYTFRFSRCIQPSQKLYSRAIYRNLYCVHNYILKTPVAPFSNQD